MNKKTYKNIIYIYVYTNIRMIDKMSGFKF